MILVDTSILSLVLRRRNPDRLSPRERSCVDDFLALSDRGDVVLMGVIRQELLSGIRLKEQFIRLQQILNGYDYIDVTLADYDAGAECFNLCRSSGVAAGDIDMLICAVAIRQDMPVFTADPDFMRYAKLLPLRLHHA